jgi:hypothetical protein
METKWRTEAVATVKMVYMTHTKGSFGEDPNSFLAIVKRDPENEHTSIGAVAEVIRGNEIIRRKNYVGGKIAHEYSLGVFMDMGGGSTMWSSWPYKSEDMGSFPIAMVANYELGKNASNGGITKINVVAYPSSISGDPRRLKKVQDTLERQNTSDRKGLELQIQQAERKKKIPRGTGKSRGPTVTPERQEKKKPAKTERRSGRKKGSESPSKRPRADMSPPPSPEPPINPSRSPNPVYEDSEEESEGSGDLEDESGSNMSMGSDCDQGPSPNQ